MVALSDIDNNILVSLQLFVFLENSLNFLLASARTAISITLAILILGIGYVELFHIKMNLHSV